MQPRNRIQTAPPCNLSEGGDFCNWPPPRKRVGLAISSGGAKGLAHVGVIQVLEENNILIDAVAGASMGSYVGALWCAGYKGPQLFKLAAEIQTPQVMRRLADVAFPPMKGLFHGKKAKRHLRRSIGDITFEKLHRSLYVVAADVDSNERVVFHHGRVIDAVHASCAMPGVIVPVKHQGRRCIDGGVVDPLPVSVLQSYADVDITIAVTTIPTIEEIDHCELVLPPNEKTSPLGYVANALSRRVNLLAKGNVIDTFNSALKSSQIRMARESCKRADIVIRPVSCIGRWYDYHEYKHFIEIGRQAAERALPQIRKLLLPTIESNETPASTMVGERFN